MKALFITTLGCSCGVTLSQTHLVEHTDNAFGLEGQWRFTDFANTYVVTPHYTFGGVMNAKLEIGFLKNKNLDLNALLIVPGLEYLFIKNKEGKGFSAGVEAKYEYINYDTPIGPNVTNNNIYAGGSLYYQLRMQGRMAIFPSVAAGWRIVDITDNSKTFFFGTTQINPSASAIIH